jgi:hypothetical protein
VMRRVGEGEMIVQKTTLMNLLCLVVGKSSFFCCYTVDPHCIEL